MTWRLYRIRMYFKTIVQLSEGNAVEATAVSFQQAVVRICEVRLTDPQKKNLLSFARVFWRSKACLLDPGGRWKDDISSWQCDYLVVSFVGVSFVGQCDILTC